MPSEGETSAWGPLRRQVTNQSWPRNLISVAVKTRVYVETGGKKTFASAADWPGWSRGGKDEKAALQALADYAPRYAKVAKLAKIDFPADATNFSVIERVNGSASTDFGVPGTPAKNESDKAFTDKEAERLALLVEAAWKYLDQVRAKSPQELRKGPRGGGRDRDKMYAHVIESEGYYAKAMGIASKAPDRKELSKTFRNPNKDAKWPVAYAMRRIAWHALDHAWEMEDRIP